MAVAVGVVEDLEAVDVAHHHGRPRAAVRAGERLVEGGMVAEAGERIGLRALAQRAHQLDGPQARGPVGGELLEQLDVAAGDRNGLGRRQDDGADELALYEEPHRHHRLHPGRTQLGQVGGRWRIGRADGEARDPVLQPVGDRLQASGAQERGQRARRGDGRSRPPPARTEQRGVQRDDVSAASRSTSATAWASCSAAMSATWRSIAASRTRSKAAQRLDARAERRGALARMVEVAVAQGLARLRVEHADGQPRRR